MFDQFQRVVLAAAETTYNQTIERIQYFLHDLKSHYRCLDTNFVRKVECNLFVVYSNNIRVIFLFVGSFSIEFPIDTSTLCPRKSIKSWSLDVVIWQCLDNSPSRCLVRSKVAGYCYIVCDSTRPLRRTSTCNQVRSLHCENHRESHHRINSGFSVSFWLFSNRSSGIKRINEFHTSDLLDIGSTSKIDISLVVTPIMQHF